jgi:hypothetical protein
MSLDSHGVRRANEKALGHCAAQDWLLLCTCTKPAETVHCKITEFDQQEWGRPLTETCHEAMILEGGPTSGSTGCFLLCSSPEISACRINEQHVSCRLPFATHCCICPWLYRGNFKRSTYNPRMKQLTYN